MKEAEARDVDQRDSLFLRAAAEPPPWGSLKQSPFLLKLHPVGFHLSPENKP